MFSLVQKRKWYYIISAILVVPGILAMIYSIIATGAPMPLGIDFTGGSRLELRFERPVVPGEVRDVVLSNGLSEATVQTVTDDQSVVIRSKPMDVDTKEAVKAALIAAFGKATELQYENVGPAVGRETTRAAFLAIVASSAAILLFVGIAFRKVQNAWRYGVCAIVKMLHDVIFLVGAASILGLVVGWEADAMFLTAVLTVVGFSVQDVIVVFDRIRENAQLRRGDSFEVLVNRSLLETLHRSLATQLNAIFVMVAIIFFGGVTIQQFMITMLMGMVVGTYSSLFFAVPLLVSWELGEIGRFFGRKQATA